MNMHIRDSHPGAPSAQADRPFDGIICIGGEDWWYHNRGHFDFQIMRRLARHTPVLFVNSIGVRMPSLSRRGLFLNRIGRKLKSFSRGLVEAEPGFWVYSPVSAPGRFASMSRTALSIQIRIAAACCGIRNPLLWVHCPAGAGLVDVIPSAAVVLQRTDRFEAFPEGDPELLGAQITALKKRADLVVYAAPSLHAEECSEVRRSILLTHGVDLDTFRSAGAVSVDPPECRTIGRPRIGFIGGIDHHTFAPELFLDVATRLPDCQFMMVGGCSLPESWCTLPNVHFLGRKPYDDIASYMAAADVLIMPWNDSEWIKACNPIKLKEYLATGRPVVTTDFAALDGWRDLVHVANEAEGFTAAIRRALAQPLDRDLAMRRLANETWDAKADVLAGELSAVALQVAATSR